MLIVGRIRDSSTFAAGQRSEMGRYEDLWEVSLSSLGIGPDCSRNYVRGECLCHLHWFSLGLPCY